MKLTTVEELLLMWEKDSFINEDMIGKESLKVPQLHSKYSNFLINHNLLAKKLHFDLVDLKAKKFSWYMGAIPKEELDELGWTHYYNPTKMKVDIPPLLDRDQDIINLSLNQNNHSLVLNHKWE